MSALTYAGQPMRAQFDMPADVVYLRAGNICPCARPVAQAMREFLDVWSRGGDQCWALAEAAFAESKRLFAGLIGASPADIATIENTSMGLSMAAALIAPRTGSNVVLDTLTHQSNVYPWMLRPDVEIRYAPAVDGQVPLSAFAALVDDRTAAIDVCHVSMGHGFRHDLAALGELAHAHGAYLVVDAAQSAGVVPIGVARMGIDFLACPTFKWLFGPLGAGFLYVRPDLLTLGPPPLVGWMSARNPGAFDVYHLELHDDARRLQRGVHNAIGLAGAAAGLRMVTQIGQQRIWEHVRLLTRRLMDGIREAGLPLLTPAEDDRRASIVAFRAGDAADFCQRLAEQGILAGQYLPGQIRLDIAAYHELEDVERTLQAIRRLARTDSA